MLAPAGCFAERDPGQHSPMDEDRSNGPLTSDDAVRESLDDAADATQRPHDDEEERRRRQAAAEEAERSPRRQGEGIH
jgi:hypothetical protein